MPHIVEILEHPSVKKYFLDVLKDSKLSDEEKYNKFISFFEIGNELQERLLRYGPQLASAGQQEGEKLVSAAAQDMGIWQPDRLMRRTEGSINRAIIRITKCQHRDGGWGYRKEQSNTWGTAHALLSLLTVRKVLGTSINFEQAIEKGITWLKKHRSEWSVSDVPPQESRSIYDASLAIRTLYQTGDRDFPAVLASLRALKETQNIDGGWDHNVWGIEWLGDSRVFSEVGATGVALEAFAATADAESRLTVQKGLDWLIKMQNTDGSWNDKSCTPLSVRVEGQPSVTKTCDALKGILAAKSFGIETEVQSSIDHATRWILTQEKVLLSDSGIAGWGYDDKGEQFTPNLDSTCLTLETLARIQSMPLPLLTANARWLMDAQDSYPGSIENGKWAYGDTFRITLGLINYYKRLKNSQFLSPTNAGDKGEGNS